MDLFPRSSCRKVELSTSTLKSPEAIIVPHYEIGTLALDGWAVIFGTARRGLGGAVARPVYAPWFFIDIGAL